MCLLAFAGVFADAAAAQLDLTLRKLVKSESDQERWRVVETNATWRSAGTAAVVCDMWDQHWCIGATARVAEMAPRMNEFITKLRDKGVLIIHCPSDTLRFYEDSAGRKLAQAAPAAPDAKSFTGWASLDLNEETPLPIDDSDGGCDDVPQCKTASPWSRQISALEIREGDAITDNVEAYNLMRHRGVTNVIVMGVHQNMCVLGRPFGIRQMVRAGQNVVLVRDLTDSMYNSRCRPFVDHFTGNELVTRHIEKYWCPTITSDQVLGGEAFRFSADKRTRGESVRDQPRPVRAGTPVSPKPSSTATR